MLGKERFVADNIFYAVNRNILDDLREVYGEASVCRRIETLIILLVTVRDPYGGIDASEIGYRTAVIIVGSGDRRIHRALCSVDRGVSLACFSFCFSFSRNVGLSRLLASEMSSARLFSSLGRCMPRI